RAHGETHLARFYLFFMLAIAVTIGGAFAGNLLTLYLFYEALTLATYPLVTHGREERDRAAGRTYLTVLLGTSDVFLLSAMGWTYVLTGSLSFVEDGVFRQGGEHVPGVSPGLVALMFALLAFGTGTAALSRLQTSIMMAKGRR